jgi:hypothetical protein
MQGKVDGEMRWAVAVAVGIVGALALPATALAVSGVAGNAAQVQYGALSQEQPELLGEERSSPGGDESAPLGVQEASPVVVTNSPGGAGGSRDLPFTGYLVIATLLTGVALLAGGSAFRRSIAR